MAVVDAVVPFLLNNITQLLRDEVELLSGVQDKIEPLQKKLNLINGFLRDTEGKRNNHEVKAVIEQIRDDVNEAQDVIDNYVAYRTQQSRRTLIGKAFHSIDYGKMLHEVNDKIDNLNKSIDEIYHKKDEYGIKKGESTGVELKIDESLRKLRENVEEDEVVGFDNYAKEVIELLREGSSRREVVSIVGMGGLGKTTLARKVFKEDNVKNHFDYCAWAYVSEDFRPRDVLLSLLRCLKSVPEDKIINRKADNENDKQSEEEVVGVLKMMLRKCLKGARYLIVLDDIWKMQVWNEIQDAFPDEKNSSRILITSREVAFYTSHSNPYKLPPLNEEDSWILFCKKVFRGEEHCPEELKDPAKKMVAKCKGLPLSILVVAGLLQQKERSKAEWRDINEDVISKIAEDEVGRVKDILKLSYDNLPRWLKPCFLYLGIYPEDYEIPVRQLIHLWIAEGLVEHKKNKSVEEVADKDYLKELIHRNLVQVATKRTDGGPKTCRIHDLLRELCISESNKDKFFEIFTSNNITMKCKPRRLSVHCSTPSYISASSCDHSFTRSLFCFGQQEKYSFGYSAQKWLLKHFKLIRVLDAGEVSSFSFPEKLDKLIHLRYLRVDAKSPFYMKDSICELWNLETLDMRNCSARSFPDCMWKLKQLRHLYISGEVALSKFPNSQIFSHLQTLCTIALNRKNVLLLEEGRFPNLRKLGLEGGLTDERDRLKLLFKSLQCLTHLNTLKIIFRPPDFAKSDQFPPNLTKITLLKVYVLTEESMNALGNLPSLQYLKVRGFEHPYKFDCLSVPAGFDQLQVFQMTSLGCKTWKLGQGAMPQLRHLVIKQCEYLTQLPNELCSSTALQEVEICKEMVEILENLDEVKKDCKLIVKD